MASRVLCVLLTFQVVFCAEQYRNDGFIDRLSSGMKFAKDFLGSESVALKVAEFVVNAFQTTKRPTTDRKWPHDDAYGETLQSEKDTHGDKPDNDFGYENYETASTLSPLKHLVRLFGLQPNQISAVAVNALVFVAQMISTFLTGPRQSSKPYRSEDHMAWMLNKNSKSLQKLIAAAKNKSLPESIHELIKEQGTEEETSCIQLLICKVTPFIYRMQKAVFSNDTKGERLSKRARGADIMYRHLPNSQEINARSDICEQRHKECDVN